jgi:hypothetical protein
VAVAWQMRVNIPNASFFCVLQWLFTDFAVQSAYKIPTKWQMWFWITHRLSQLRSWHKGVGYLLEMGGTNRSRRQTEWWWQEVPSFVEIIIDDNSRFQVFDCNRFFTFRVYFGIYRHKWVFDYIIRRTVPLIPMFLRATLKILVYALSRYLVFFGDKTLTNPTTSNSDTTLHYKNVNQYS